MLAGLNAVEQFWSRTRDNLTVMRSSEHKDFWLFESSVWFHMLANSMLAIYIPILMLQAGFSLSDILLFYVVLHVVNVPANYLAGILTGRIGARKTIIVGTLFQIGFFVTYSIISPEHFGLLLVLGILAALYDALYYTASMYLFMQATVDANNSGKNTGILYAVIRSAGLIGPVIGSSILVLGGNPGWVIVAVIVSFIISIIPLFWTSLEHGQRATMQPLKHFVKEPYVWANHISLGLYKIHESIGAILWPIFLYLYFGSLESIAILAVLVPIVGLAISFYSGHINLRWRYHATAISALLVGMIWIGRVYVEHGVWYYLSAALAATIMIFMQVPIDANIFRTGNQTNALSAAVFRNMCSMAVKSVLFIILWLASLSFESTFAIAALAMVLLTTLSVLRIYLPQYTDPR